MVCKYIVMYGMVMYGIYDIYMAMHGNGLHVRLWSVYMVMANLLKHNASRSTITLIDM